MIHEITALELYRSDLPARLFESYQHALDCQRVKPGDRILDGFRFIRLNREYTLTLCTTATLHGFEPMIELRVGTFCLDRVVNPQNGDILVRMLKRVL